MLRHLVEVQVAMLVVQLPGAAPSLMWVLPNPQAVKNPANLDQDYENSRLLVLPVLDGIHEPQLLYRR